MSDSLFRSLLLLNFLWLPTGLLAQEVPSGVGQLETPPSFFPGGKDANGRSFSYLGQASGKGKIILTASNGFFTKGVCRAAGESSLPKIGDEELIVPNFGWLENWKETDGSSRWYLHLSKPGEVRVQAYLEVGSGTEDSSIEVRFGDQVKTVSTETADGNTPQQWDLVFQVDNPGEHLLSLQARKIGDPETGVGKLHHIDVFGRAIDEARLLRARWRPAAVHGGYSASKVENSTLLVMTTRSVLPISNYSPVTTPFGYFGTVFTDDGRSNGDFNFSMWGNDRAASDLRQMPHLLGLGSPEGEFSGFGHEGSGVKPRGWTPMPDAPQLVVQALRVEPGDLYDTYYGYYFDHPEMAWKFFCSGNKWHGGKPKTHLNIGSFCEVPGPPHVERTGDIYREVRRRGWYHSAGQWIQMDTFQIGGAGSKGDIPVNKRWYTTEEGEFAMGCGGIRFYHAVPPQTPPPVTELPYFLKSESLPEVLAMPIEFGEIEVVALTPESSTIEVTIEKGDKLREGALYFGTTDALTFAPRELHGTERNSTLSQTVNENTWQQKSDFDSVEVGPNRIVLSDLEPDTTYYFRPLVSNSVSRVWSQESFSFTTPKPGTASKVMKRSPINPDDEPVRAWTYTIAGTRRTLEGRLLGIEGSKVQIARKADGKKGTLEIQMLSAEDQAFIKGRK